MSPPCERVARMHEPVPLHEFVALLEMHPSAVEIVARQRLESETIERRRSGTQWMPCRTPMSRHRSAQSRPSGVPTEMAARAADANMDPSLGRRSTPSRAAPRAARNSPRNTSATTARPSAGPRSPNESDTARVVDVGCERSQRRLPVTLHETHLDGDRLAARGIRDERSSDGLGGREFGPSTAIQAEQRCDDPVREVRRVLGCPTRRVRCCERVTGEEKGDRRTPGESDVGGGCIIGAATRIAREPSGDRGPQSMHRRPSSRVAPMHVIVR